MEVPSDPSIIAGLADDLAVAIWVARAPGGEFIFANRLFGEIMGQPGHEGPVVGDYASPYGIFTRDGTPYPEHRLPFVRALEERQVVVVDDIVIHRPDGTRVSVRAYARPVIGVDAVITHVVIAFIDITREIELEQARLESEHRLHRAQRLESIGTLAGGVAHDFNNLVFGIKLIVAELLRTEVDPARRESLELIDDTTKRAATLTDSLLGFARRGKHRASRIALDDIVAEMREMLARTLAGVDLAFDLGAEHRGAIVGDQAQLEQVVLNLVVNARDAVGGSGRVIVRTRTADAAPANALGVFAGGRATILEVADDGPGIPDTDRERVFEPYFTTKTKGPDHGGLGLATVLGIAESHGGSVEIAEGLDGRGTTLRVYLPAAAPLPDVVRPPLVASVEHTGTILIVDDDRVVRRALAVCIGELGYTTLEAASGAEAVELYRQRGREIRAVVLDMVMPGLSGRATYLALRTLAPDIAVLLMSGYTMNEDVQEILDLGVRSFISKPYSLDALARELALITAR